MRFFLRRLFWSGLILFAVLSVVFVLLFGVGDPAAATLGPQASPQALESFRHKYGLDQPLHKQYLSYLGVLPCVRKAETNGKTGTKENRENYVHYCGLLQGNLGQSFRQNEPVTDAIVTRLPRTFLLGALAMGFELLFGIAIGIVAAVKRRTWTDTAIMTLSYLGISAPTFLTGLFFLNWFAFRLGWFPVGGYGVDFWDHIRHALLPAFTLAIGGAATYARIMRSELIDVLKSEYVRTAHAKGLHPMRVLFVHAVPNALLPIVTLVGLQLSALVSGAVITESIFAWPGIGRLAIESIYNLDVFTVMGVVLMAAIAVQLGNFLADLAMYALDPRIRRPSQ